MSSSPPERCVVALGTMAEEPPELPILPSTDHRVLEQGRGIPSPTDVADAVERPYKVLLERGELS